MYGIYSGFELNENVQRPGSEEYIDNEKYELKSRDWNAPGNINADVATLNRIRRENRALQLADNLAFGESENDRILVFAKTAPGNALIVAVNTDPHHAQETTVTVPLAALGLGPDDGYGVHDLLTGARYAWRGARNYVRLDPSWQPGHILRIER